MTTILHHAAHLPTTPLVAHYSETYDTSHLVDPESGEEFLGVTGRVSEPELRLIFATSDTSRFSSLNVTSALLSLLQK